MMTNAAPRMKEDGMIDDQSTKHTLNHMIFGFRISQAIYVAAELGIADLLIEGPRTAEDLAEQTRTHSEALYRLLRALASVGIFAEDTHRLFSLTPLAENLRSDLSDSQRSFAMMAGAELYQAWGDLLYSIQTEKPAFTKRFGMPMFQYLAVNPERGKLFDAAMTGLHSGETAPMIDAYDFSQFQTVVDIGGGNGLVLAAVLNRHAALHGVLFDMPDVVERARLNIVSAGLSDRCQVVGGDFFASVPAGGDAYVMRHILHDWDDDEAVAILRNCRKAMLPGGKVVVVESVIPPGNEPSLGKWLDLSMLVSHSGRERTKEQYRRLFAEAGLTLHRIISTTVETSMIEGGCSE